jgi:hypothetical protein
MIRTVTSVIVAIVLAGTASALAQSRHRQTLGAEAAPGTWRPLSLKCGATYEVTFLDNEARDWVEFRLGKLGYGQASFGRNGRLQVVVHEGVPRKGTTFHVPASLCPGGRGYVTLSTFSLLGRSGWARVAIIDEVE